MVVNCQVFTIFFKCGISISDTKLSRRNKNLIKNRYKKYALANDCIVKQELSRQRTFARPQRWHKKLARSSVAVQTL